MPPPAGPEPEVAITRAVPTDTGLAPVIAGAAVRMAPALPQLSRAELLGFVRGAAAVISMFHDRVDAEFLAAAGPQLRGVCNFAVGVDNIDLAAQATGGGDDARELATTMSSAFVAFARTGDPSTASAPRWPAFTAADRQMMIFDNGQSAARRDPDIDARRVLQAALGR